MTRKTYPHLLLNLAAATFLVGTVAGQAQAHTVWRFPYKSAPYAVPHDHNNRGAVGQKTWNGHDVRYPVTDLVNPANRKSR